MSAASSLHAIEAAALAAWPAFEEGLLHGWRLRFARGYTKRANSANCLPGCEELGDAHIADIEQWFEARGLPSVFRLTSLSTPPHADHRLADKGYRFTDLSLVMAKPLVGLAPEPALCSTSDAEAWLQAFQEVSGQLGPEQTTHLKLLRAIQNPCAFAVQAQGGVPACVGLAVCVQDQLGLFDIATRADWRRNGLAKQLCSSLLAWGVGLGAQTAFLQVTAANAAAIGLYESLGFRRAYEYWYRVKP